MIEPTFNLTFFKEWFSTRIFYLESLGFKVDFDFRQIEIATISLDRMDDPSFFANISVYSDGAVDSFYNINDEERSAHSSIASLIDFFNFEAEILYMAGLNNEAKAVLHRSLLRTEYPQALMGSAPFIRNYKIRYQLAIEKWFRSTQNDFKEHYIVANLSGVGRYDELFKIVYFDSPNFVATLILNDRNKADLYVCTIDTSLVRHYDLGILKKEKDFAVVPTALFTVSI